MNEQMMQIVKDASVKEVARIVKSGALRQLMNEHEGVTMIESIMSFDDAKRVAKETIDRELIGNKAGPLTTDQLVEISARYLASTGGEWTFEAVVEEFERNYDYSEIVTGWSGNTRLKVLTKVPWNESIGTENDLTFIAHAHQDIPALLAEVHRLRQEADFRRKTAVELNARCDQLEVKNKDVLQFLKTIADFARTSMEATANGV